MLKADFLPIYLGNKKDPGLVCRVLASQMPRGRQFENTHQKKVSEEPG
jgi:hypothetical protein